VTALAGGLACVIVLLAAVGMPQAAAWAAPRARGGLPLGIGSAMTAPVSSTVVFLPLVAKNAISATNWLQFGGNAQHSGENTQEAAIGPANVATLVQKFQVGLPAVADGAPAYLAGVATPGGQHNLLFMTLTDGTLVAADAQSGTVVWSAAHAASGCEQFGGGGACFTTSSPAVDPSLQYVYSYGLDGYVHKHWTSNGSEVTSGGWPVQATLQPGLEKGSSALSIATTPSGASYLYVTNAAFPAEEGDNGYFYQGHMTAINLANAATNVFNAGCSNQAGLVQPGSSSCGSGGWGWGIWARPGTVYEPDTDRIYVATGNATFDPATFSWGDSVLALSSDGLGSGGAPLDSYTPTDQADLNTSDTDLGSTAPAILPIPSGSDSRVQHLGMQGGKDGLLRLLNLDNLSGLGGPGHTGGELGQTVQVQPSGEQVLAQPAVWVNPADGSTWTFVATRLGLTGLRVAFSASGAPSLQTMWNITPAGTSTGVTGGTSPVVANNVVYGVWGGMIIGVDPLTGNLLWRNSSIGSIHWESPIVVNGMVYITDESGDLTAFGLPPAGAGRAAGTRK
jgi:hypothetical protein